jgi:hypothetical protein
MMIGTLAKALDASGAGGEKYALKPGGLLLHFMVCHSKSAKDPAPEDIIKTTRWNSIQDANRMHKM